MPSIKEKSLKNTAIALGKKLGFLIASLFVKDEERQAALALTQKMTPAQLMEFTNLLEEEYLVLMAKPADAKYKQSLQVAYNNYQIKQQDLDQTTMKKLAALEKKLGASSKK